MPPHLPTAAPPATTTALPLQNRPGGRHQPTAPAQHGPTTSRVTSPEGPAIRRRRGCPHGRTADDLLGVPVAGYTPLEVLRRRGCQNVYRAKTPGGGHAALKTTCLDADPNALARARNEVLGLRQTATHPLVADLVGHGNHDGLHYLATAWQRGVSLHQLLEHLDRSMTAWSPTGAEVFTRLALALCHALDGLHHHGVVHGDLSPRNILAGHGTTITLIDLDSCARTGDPDPALRRGATIMYAAPECLAPRPRPVPGPTADQYSTAAILYRVLQQRHHLPHATRRATVREFQLTRPPRLLTGWPATTWPGLAAVLHQALHPDSEHRHPTTGDFTSHLRAALALARSGATP
ncbi:hypothetical protein GCM10010430_68330 [Kitasatospora cystarginea]|uniref:Protein kinase domain-containing protein n=1 Tax=Kitasatospora cystarginea TaxID=58350 RepID=A0ABP5RRX1_9ACTN